MSTERFTCGRRKDPFAFGAGVENEDYWRSDETCSYCGSMSQERFFELVGQGVEIGPTDKNYKAYVDGHRKFYFQHLDEAGRDRFLELHNAGAMNLGYPGRFYRLPYFLVPRGSGGDV